MKKKGKFEASKRARPTQAQKASAPKTPKPEKQRSGKGAKIAAVSLAALLIIAVLGVCAYGMYLKGQDAIFPNVYVAGVNVGGLKEDAAVLSVEESVENKTSDNTLNVVLPDRTIAFTPEVTQVALNADDAVAKAMAYGRDAGPIGTLFAYYHAKNSEYNVNLESSMSLDTDYIRELIDQTAYSCRSDKIDPIVKVDEKARTITVTAGSPALSLDADKLYDAVLERFTTGDFSDLEFEYEQEPCAVVDLESYYQKYCRGMKDAYYDEEKKELVPEENGYGFDVPYYTQQLDMAEPGTTVTIQMEDMAPEVTLAKLQEIYFKDTLSSYSSPHTAQASRTKNLELACKSINGTILNPGEEFSFNKIVGERTPDKGYQEAIVYTTGGKSEAESGGGVCQVASTIYTCCLLADLKVTERSPHMYLVTYVEEGMDATIYWGLLDFKFQNSTEYPLRVDASVSGGYVHIALVGTQPEKDYDHIKLHGDIINVKDWKTVIDDPNKSEDKKTEITVQKGAGKDAKGNAIDIAVDSAGNKYTLKEYVNSPYTGYTVKAYRDFCAADGSVLKSELLHTDVFSVRHQSYKVEPYVEPEIPEPEPEEPENPEDPLIPVDPDDPSKPDDPSNINPYYPFEPTDPISPWWP